MNIGYVKTNNTVLDKMQTGQNFVKYYYMTPPKTAMNFTATINVNMFTDGFYSSIYVLRNDLANNSFNFT